jgi:response regulator RpfG family c-di-GMP phosphodiesterase
MTLFLTTSHTTDAVRLLSAVGDTFGGHRIGFGMRVANVAARFAQHRGAAPDVTAATFFGAALHRIGAVRVIVPRDATPRVAEIARWDDPPAGAAFIAATGVFPAATADAVRWHREAFDGTGFPDQLRWNGIPETAMMINIARAFVDAAESQGPGAGAGDALFLLVEQSGCVYSLSTMRDFRMFLASCPDAYDADYEPDWPLFDSDATALVVRMCDEIDARHPRTIGRGERLERIVRAIIAKLPDDTIDAERAAFAGRLTALTKTGLDGGADDVFTLSRLGLETRAAAARNAALVLAAAPSFAEFAPIVGAIEEWYDGSGLPDGRAGSAIDPVARILAVAVAADAVSAGEARQRITAAAGKRLDPVAVEAYFAAGPRR